MESLLLGSTTFSVRGIDHNTDNALDGYEFNAHGDKTVVVVIAIVCCIAIGVVAIVCILVARQRCSKNLEYESMVNPSLLLPFCRRSKNKNENNPSEICVLASTMPSPSCQSEAGSIGPWSLSSGQAASSSSLATSATGRRLSLDYTPRVKETKAGLECVQNLGSLDPSLYKPAENGSYDADDDNYPDGHIGRIRFAVQYMKDSEKLQVTLINAKNLPSRILGSANACDPFIKLCLLPDTRSHMQTKFRKKTCNPKIDETFVFQVPRGYVYAYVTCIVLYFTFQVSSKNLDERVLKLTVYDVDRLRRHNLIGHVLYPLKNCGICDKVDKLIVSRDLEHEVIEKTTELNGELLVSLCFNDRMERLNVGIYEARNIAVTDPTNPDFYVKVSLMKNNSVVKTKKTDVIRDDSSPKFNVSFSFKQAADGLDATSVVITILQSISGQKDKPVGRVVVGSFMFARGKELDHWNEMLANQKEQVSHWHALV